MTAISEAYRFGPFRLDAMGYRLLRDEAPIPLSPKALDLLLLFVSRPGALVSKDDILQALWADVSVTDNALTQVVSDLRQAIGDNATSPRYIQTVARRGYRFVAPVDVIAPRETRRQLGTLDLPAATTTASRIGVRETSSLEAYRVFTEARLKLEALDPALVPSAMVDFNRAIALDPRFTLAYVGRAHARFWRYEASRVRNRPDTAELRAAISDIRRAIELDPDLAEAHSSLAFFLTAANQPVEAAAAGRRAVALEPGNWRHLFRLGVAAWGDERLECFERVVEHYPEFPYAYFGIAMVHIARGDLAAAEHTLRRGLTFEPDQPERLDRFPGRGLHWLLGLTRLALGDPNEAHLEFDRELASRGGHFYAAEYEMDAYDGHGYAFLQQGDHGQAAVMFKRALEIFPDHARSSIALAAAHRRDGRTPDSSAALEHARQAIDELRANERTTEASIASALALVVADRSVDAVAVLDQLLSSAPPGFAGWTIPIEPLLSPLKNEPEFMAVLARLATRAR
jgi:DNA-binding winged helix-turn-helix (wHTH) protein/Tfp pilus assembly protein PilF